MFLMPIAIFFQVIAIPQQVLMPVPVAVPVQAIEPVPSYTPRLKKQTSPSTALVDANTVVLKKQQIDQKEQTRMLDKLADFVPKVRIYNMPDEKSKVVLSLKCPTEAIADISTPSSKILHHCIAQGFTALNYANFAPFTFEQACS